MQLWSVYQLLGVVLLIDHLQNLNKSVCIATLGGVEILNRLHGQLPIQKSHLVIRMKFNGLDSVLSTHFLLERPQPLIDHRLSAAAEL